MKKISQRAADIQPFQVMALLEQAQGLEKQGVDVIHLEVGEPDFETPQPIADAAINAIQSGKTGYTPALGLPELKAKISEYYLSEFDVTISKERIVITSGASGALQLLMAARIEAGDQVLMSEPGYPCNAHFVNTFGGEAQLITTESKDDFHLTPELIQQYWQPNTQAALLASPANPTGAVIPKAKLTHLFETVDQLGGELWVDEIYQGLTYSGNDKAVHYSALDISDEIVVINSFSKLFAMTGWRLGWMVVPEKYIDPINRLAQNLFLAPPTTAQQGAMAAFTDETHAIIEQRKNELKERRDYLLKVLPELGFKIAAVPSGAFYIYLDAQALTDNSEQFCQDLLVSKGVALTPGLDFDNRLGHHYIRIAYAASLERLQEAVNRIEAFLAEKS